MNPSSVEALLFDLGGVVLEVDFENVFAHLAKENSVTADQIKRAFSMDEPYRLHEKGVITGKEYFAHLRETLELTADDVSLTESWNAIFGNEIHAALDAIDQVRNRYPCYAFTNTNAVHQAYWDKHYPRIRQTFDHMFVSSQIGLRKPDAPAFTYILEQTSIEAGTMLFFDDTWENIEGAMQVGLQAIHVTSSDSVVDALKALP